MIMDPSRKPWVQVLPLAIIIVHSTVSELS
jgi:hypothetical protein